MLGFSRLIRLAACGILLTFAVGPASAQPVTSGNLIIYRVGAGGAASLAATATSIFLDEYTPAGTFVNTYNVPSAGALAMTASGIAATEGMISISQNGNFLVFTGYRKDAGLSNPSLDIPSTTNRVIGTFDINGVINTSVAVTNAGQTIRSATSVDGISSFYIGGGAGLGYVGAPGGASASTTIDSLVTRQVNLYGNTLFASNGSNTTAQKLQNYGVLPTGPASPTAVATLTNSDNIHGFFACDLNPGVPGIDTIYALSTTENLLRKYSFNSITWSAAGSISANGALNLTGAVSGSNVRLYVTSSSSLYPYTDFSGFGGQLSGALDAAIATAAANTAFRGIGTLVTPVPEPTSILLICGIGGAAGVAIRRRWATRKTIV